MILKMAPESPENLSGAMSPHKITIPEEEVVKTIKVEKPSIVSTPNRVTKKDRPKKTGAVQKLPKSELIAEKNHKLTEYFAVRRSNRKCIKVVLQEKLRDLESKVVEGCEDGLEIMKFPEKGRGIVTSKEFKKGEFVVEYIGDLIDQVTAKKREALYSKNHNTGCYMYYFQHRNQQYCVDATEETGKLGRLVNHSRNGNLIVKVVEVKNTPHLVLVAKEDLPVGTEVLYDYGDRSRESLIHHPWLAL